MCSGREAAWWDQAWTAPISAMESLNRVCVDGAGCGGEDAWTTMWMQSATLPVVGAEQIQPIAAPTCTVQGWVPGCLLKGWQLAWSIMPNTFRQEKHG